MQYTILSRNLCEEIAPTISMTSKKRIHSQKEDHIS